MHSSRQSPTVFLPPSALRLPTLLLLCLLSNASAEEFRVATFNCDFLVRPRVHVKFGVDFNPDKWTALQKTQWEQPGFRDARFHEAARAVAAVVRNVDAHLIALCEVGDERDLAELQREIAALGLDYPGVAVCDSADTATGQHVAILSRIPFERVSKTIPGREGYDRELDDPETEDDTGVSKGMSVSVRVANQTIHVYAVHLISERGGFEQDAQRIAQASIVRRNYLEQLNKGEHVIVLGDLNDHRGQPAIRRIRGQDDIFADLLQTGNATFFPPDKLDTRWTYEFQGERQQIDHVLITRSLKDACRRSGVRSRVFPVTETIERTTIPASDHRPISVTLDFQE